MSHIVLSICDYNRNKLCDIFDSDAKFDGQAYDISVTKQIDGWKEISFTLPLTFNGERNFMWDYIKNEHLLRYVKDNEVDWYVIVAPSDTRNGKSTSSTITCSHISSIQKTKNLYLELDDENGIGTIEYLMNLVLRGTGWTLGECDTFLETDGVTEKVRTVKSEAKVGAYQQVTSVCNMFNAFPVYNGDTKTVNVYSLNRRENLLELTIGKNLNSIKRIKNSEEIITRLYVEGEYGDFGYVGIDDVNPTGLSFLLNFDYYRQLGMFTPEHELALAEYLDDVARVKNTTSQIVSDKNILDTSLNELWGQINYVVYELEDGDVTDITFGGSSTSTDAPINAGDVVAVLHTDDTYTLVTVPQSGEIFFDASDKYAVKYVNRAAGKIGGKEVAVEAKEITIANQEEDYVRPGLSDEKKAAIQEQINALHDEIELIYEGDDNNVGLYEMFKNAVDFALGIRDKQVLYNDAVLQQEEIESAFSEAMGDMLKDGYWSDANYVPGQEQQLYNDAVEIMNVLSKPSVSYDISAVLLAEVSGYEIERFDLNTSVHIYDAELNVNDFCYVDKYILRADDRMKDSISISNEYLRIQGKTFESLLNRITQLSDTLKRKQSVYDRAESLTSGGRLAIDRLEGIIDVTRTKILSSISSWYTDQNGNMVFESVNGLAAMMLSGEGFLIASSKTPNGGWNWRTAGTGAGLTADAIVTGFLSADRIEAGTITVNKLSSDVGQSLDLSSNHSIVAVVQNMVGYRVEIEGEGYISSTFPSTTLKAIVYMGNMDVTDTLSASRFNWKRTSENPADDIVWNDAHMGMKSITVTRSDVSRYAEFTCELVDN